MCTVTYIPVSNGFILTSNRDESVFRPTLKPNYYSIGQNELVFPKDEVADGTWIAGNGNGRLVCLLNGAFETHKRKEAYRKSRGKVLLESFEYKSISDFIQNADFQGIEPFTILLIDYQNGFEFKEIRWDEQELHISEIDIKKNQIWSSATLYDRENRTNREKLFENWISKYSEEREFNILDFHKQSQYENKVDNILTNRENGLKTVSVTQFIIQDEKKEMRYFDLLKKEQTIINLVNKEISEAK